MTDEHDATTRRGTYAKGIARRQEILDRAIEVFARRGSDRTSLRAIAREVGVTHAALAHYFGSLEELLVAVYRETEKPLDPSSAASSWPPQTPVGAMRESARRNRDVPGLVQLYSTLVAAGLAEDHPSAREFASTRFSRLREEIAARVREGQADGALRPDVDPLAAAALIIAASDGLQTQWLLDESAPQDEALALLDHLIGVRAASE